MRELTLEGVNAVAGAGWLADLVDDIQYAIEQAPSLYKAAIESTADIINCLRVVCTLLLSYAIEA